MTTNNRLNGRAKLERGDGNDDRHSTPQKTAVQLPPEFDCTCIPEEWEKLRQRATHPLSLEHQLERALAACEVERENRKLSNYALSSDGIEWNWRMTLLILWMVLIAVMCAAAM